jgi:hypothetical protein
MALAVATTLGGGIFAGIEVLQAAQATTGPVARYAMRAGTTSGFGAMGGGGMGGMIGGALNGASNGDGCP